jgi:hypothetical protein
MITDSIDPADSLSVRDRIPCQPASEGRIQPGQ